MSARTGMSSGGKGMMEVAQAPQRVRASARSCGHLPTPGCPVASAALPAEAGALGQPRLAACGCAKHFRAALTHGSVRRVAEHGGDLEATGALHVHEIAVGRFYKPLELVALQAGRAGEHRESRGEPTQGSLQCCLLDSPAVLQLPRVAADRCLLRDWSAQAAPCRLFAERLVVLCFCVRLFAVANNSCAKEKKRQDTIRRSQWVRAKAFIERPENSNLPTGFFEPSRVFVRFSFFQLPFRTLSSFMRLPFHLQPSAESEERRRMPQLVNSGLAPHNAYIHSS